MARFTLACSIALCELGQAVFVSPITEMCLGIDGDAKKMANVVLNECKDNDANQAWVVKDGQIVNPASNLCLDIYAPCADPDEEKAHKAGCKRKTGAELEAGGNVQVYTCHEACSPKGNQQWVVNSNGTLVNEHAGVCLDIYAPCADPDEEKAHKKGCKRTKAVDLKDGANVQVWHCHTEVYGNQIWDLETTKQAEDAFKAKTSAKFTVLDDKLAGSSNSNMNTVVAAVAGAASMAVAMVVGSRVRQARSAQNQALPIAE